jgi:HlyD family secretion protein
MTKKIIIAVVVLAVLGAIGYANFAFTRPTGATVTTEKITRRDLEAVVTSSGKIALKRYVNVSAEATGRVMKLAVKEGDHVVPGQLLLEIDPRTLQMQYDGRKASLDSATSQLEQSKQQVEGTRLALKQAQDNLLRAEAQNQSGLISRQEYERAQNDVKIQMTTLRQVEQAVRTQELRIKGEQASFESARTDLKKIQLDAPIEGIVTALNIQEGELAVFSTMSSAARTLLTIGDLSVVEANVTVDETDIPSVKVGQPTRITIDAFTNQSFPGTVTEISVTGASLSASSGTTFLVTATITGRVPDVRPGLTCSTVITTATRQQAVGVPIQAMTIREMVVDADGQIVRSDPKAARGSSAAPRPGAVADLKPGQSRKEVEGVFVVKDGHALFVPVKTGIAGEKYFEVLTGLADGDEVITGPFSSVRDLKDGDPVKLSTTARGTAAGR